MKRQDSLRMRTWFVLLWMLVGMLPLYAQNAFHVYRHNGTINTFFYANLDSITYAHTAAETGGQTTDFMQEFHTPDSVYRIPVNEIDSISFYAPPTVYKPDVVKLEESLFTYVVRSEGQNFLLKKDIPLMYVPKAGDKLVTLEMTEAFPAGFAGVVTDIEETPEGYWVKCDLPSLTDIFSSYYYEGSIDLIESETEEDPQSRASEIWPPVNKQFELPTFELSWNVLEWGLIPYEHPVSASVSQSFRCTLKSKMRLYTSLFVSHGVHFHITMTGEHELTTDISMSVTGTLTLKKGIEVPAPIPIAPLLTLYVEPGVFFELSGSYTGGYSQTEYLGSALHYSYDQGSPSNIPSQARIVSKGKSAPTADFMANVTLKAGPYGELGVAIVSNEIAKAGLGLKAGVKFDCSVNLDDVYAITSPPDTYMYEKYKGEELFSLSAFRGYGLELEALNAKSSFEGEISVGVPFLTCNLYPDFKNVKAEMVKDSIGHLKVEADVTGSCLKKDVGFALYHDDKLQEKVYYHTPFDGKTPLAMSHVFKGLEPGKSYTVYPITKVVGSMELLATPSADAKLEVDVTTGNYEGVTSSSVKLHGKVEGVDKNTDCKYGIAYKKKTDEQWTEKEATLQEDNTFSCDVTGLSPDTEYDYQAYLRMDDETYYGEIHSFKTEAKEEDENGNGDGNGEGGGNGSGGSSGGEISLREALIRIYQSTDGDNWINNENWCSDRPLNEWYGVYIEEGKGHIDLDGNNLKGVIDVSGCTSLGVLYCDENQLTSLNVSGCTSLTILDCEDNQLSSLDVYGCTSLVNFFYYYNQLTSLNVSGCTSFTTFNCNDNQLTSLNVSGCTSLLDLDCSNNQLTSLNVSGCTSLGYLYCYENQLTSLNVSGCTSLKELICRDNQLTSLNVSGCTSLERLDCSDNRLTSLSVTSCTSLKQLDCSENKISSVISSWYSQLEIFWYDQRYTNYRWEGEVLKYDDKGYGWWYPGEPGKGYHGP